MRIVHICLSGPVTDGWNYQDNLITKYQKKAGHSVTIITTKWVWGEDGQLTMLHKNDYINNDGVRVIRLDLKGRNDIKNKFKRVKNLYQTIENCKPEILFVHGVSYCDISVCTKYLRNHKAVIGYADNHADFSNSGTNWLSRKILHGIIWKHYAQGIEPYIKKFYGVLPVRVDFLVDVYGLPKEKCELLVMGADDELVKAANSPEIKRQIRDKYGILKNDFLIMTGGKIDQWKQQTLLLMEAVQKINERRVRLIVFGSVASELRKCVESFADGKKVQYIGWIPAKETYRYFASADLVVFPGRHSVFWEQVAAQGIPMLVKDWPGTHHIDLGGNVRFLLKDNAEEIKKKIETLIDNPEEYNQMKEIAKGKGKEKFSYYRIAQRSINENE